VRGILTGVGLLCVLTLLLVPASALALLDFDIAFEPTELCPGEEAQFFFYLENIGGTDEIVELAVTIEFEGYAFGPITVQFPLAAGEEITKELPFFVPPFAPPGTLTVTMVASDSGGSIEDVAELTILECDQLQLQKDGRKSVVRKFKNTLDKLDLE
jgi:hypothetical protein